MKRYLLVILMALLMALPALAQDETIEPTAVSTQEPSPVNVNINTDNGANDDLPEGNVSIPGWSIIVVIVLGIAGGASLPGIIDRIRGNPAAIAEIESRADTLPQEVTDALVKVAEVVESGARLIKEAADRTPAASKQPVAVILKQIDTADLLAELRTRGALPDNS